MNYFSVEWITSFLFSVIRISTPLMYVALCAVVSQQSGLLNMAAESMMLASALTGVIFSAVSQNLWVGILCGMFFAVLVTLFLCFATFVMKVDLYLMSIAMNTAMIGGTIFVMYALTGVKSNTAAFYKSLSMPAVDIPLVKDIPVLGAILSGHNGFTYIAVGMIFAVWFLIFKTKTGLRMRAVGQNPKAAESVGINPRFIYTLSFVIASMIASLGGMYLSMGYQKFFIREITGARGFIGMSASTIANANPFYAAAVSLVLGLSEAITNNLKVYITDAQLLSAIPHMLTIALIMLLAAIRLYRQNRIQRENRVKLLKMQELEIEKERNG